MTARWAIALSLNPDSAGVASTEITDGSMLLLKISFALIPSMFGASAKM
jgi:hypothetical protein